MCLSRVMLKIIISTCLLFLQLSAINSIVYGHCLIIVLNCEIIIKIFTFNGLYIIKLK